MAGLQVRGHRTGPFDEQHASDSDLHIQSGHDLMEFFLRGGLPKSR
jgi:hypothetical protein